MAKGAGRVSESERLAGELIFYLASKDQIIQRDQLNHYLSRKGAASSLVYGRLERERSERLLGEASITKIKGEEKDTIYFGAHDIRKAALQELVKIGPGTLKVLVSSVHSARQEVSLGVLKALREFDTEITLPILSDVLERNRWTRPSFTSRVRREALRSMALITVDDERWRKIIENALIDLDPEVRHLSRRILVDQKDLRAEFASEGLQRSWNKELDLYTKSRDLAVARGLGSLFDSKDVEALSLLRALDSLLLIEEMPIRDCPEEVLVKYDTLRLMMSRIEVLDSTWRTKVLNLALAYPAGVLKVEAMRCMVPEDAESHRSQVKMFIDVHEDPAVLMESLELCLEWKLTPSVEMLTELQSRTRHDEIKSLVAEVLEAL
jgi:hypothetical protein